MASYSPTIGLEVHAELKTRTKMFCGSRNAPHQAEPNIHTCPICMGHPGTLPVVNLQAVQHVLLVGYALGGTLATYTEFDRKNYFYPDIPKGYQISQYQYPLVRGGTLEGVTITRIHLEEDTARSLHDKVSGSLVDYNRAGVPLMELVTEPVIHDAETAGRFARELQLLLRTLGVSDANMERGEMRVEVNISISSTDTFGTKVEIKNLNSFKSVEQSIAYEISRQTAMLEKGEGVIQETRGWDEIKGVTVSQRKKESSHDYRYFPDPDIPKLNLSSYPELTVSRLSEILPETPSNKRIKLSNLGLPRNIVEILISDISLGKFYDSAVSHYQSLGGAADVDSQKRIASYVTTDLLGALANDVSLKLENASPESFARLMLLIADNKITSRVAKDILVEVVFNALDPEKVISDRGLSMEGNSEQVLNTVKKVIEDNSSIVEEYKSGKTAVLQFLIGEVMKVSRGSANPNDVKNTLIENLNKN